MLVPTEIRTPRLLLRPWRPTDAAELLPILESNREHLGPWIPTRVSTPVPVPELAERLAEFNLDFESARGWRFGMFAPDESRVLGEIGLYPRDASRRVPYGEATCVELGYWLRADATGQGLVTEAAEALLALAATLPRLSHVEVRCDARNAPSAAVPKRLGFVLASTIADSGVRAGDEDVELQIWTRPLVRAEDDARLMRLHVDALYTRDDRGRMLRVNEPAGGPAPRFFLGRTARGCEWRVRDDVTDDVVAELAAAVARERSGDLELTPPDAPTPYESILARVTPVERVESGPAFVCPPDLGVDARAIRITNANAELLRTHLSAWLGDVQTAQPMFALVVDGDAVALCASVRITPAAHEAGVETTPAYRKQGYAAAVVSAWAKAVREAGAEPLYSTSWRNVASRAVARKLGLRLFGSDLHFT